MIEALSVSELIYEIKTLLEDNYQSISCIGEISNLSYSASGHYYFNLSDKDASISCALFKMDALRNSIIRTVKNGDKVIIYGPISLYAKRGTFQVLVKNILKSGKGTLLEEYNKLKTKLQAEGLFELSLKKPIPKFAKKCVLITASESAAMADFLNVYDRRALMGEIIVIPALVQGEKSELSLLNALDKAFEIKDLDVIVMSRGGGSMEDLWSFNSEKLARKIYVSPIPIISAIGHQVDYTICDFVSDLRVETPTAAAEKLTEKQVEISNRMLNSKKSLILNIEKKIDKLKQATYNLSPLNNINRISNKIRIYENRLQAINLLKRSRELLNIEDKIFELEDLQKNLETSMISKLKNFELRLKHSHSSLKNLNPRGILKRGYSIISQNNNIIPVSSKLSLDENFEIEFFDKTINVTRNIK